MTEIEKMIWAAAFANSVNDNSDSYACARAARAVGAYRKAKAEDYNGYIGPEHANRPGEEEK